MTRVLMRAQRSSWRPPPAIRRIAGRVLQRGVSSANVVDDWSTSLRGEPRAEAPPLEAVDVSRVSGPGPAEVAGRRLRCVLVSHLLDVGGTEEVLAFLARRLPDHGIDTTVMFTRPAPGTVSRLAVALRSEGIEVVEVDETTVGAALDAHRPDVISAHGPPEWWMEAASERGIPYLETLHGMHSFFGIDWAAEARRSRGVTRFVAVSELVRRQYLAGNSALDPERIVTVPNSVDQARIPRLDRAACRAWLGLDDEFLFVSLARFTLQKNPFGLIAAFDEVATERPDVHLLIAGRPDEHAYPHQVRRLRDELAARDRIHLRDHAPWPAVPLAAADAFVMDSYFEGWSLASMEGLYAGLPVVLSDVGGGREQVGETGERGYLVPNPVGDPLAVTWETIGETLYSEQPNRAELVQAMARVADERSTWSARREDLRTESAARFHPDHALRGHAAVIRAAADSA
jgi:glycosyltransferase involved in cell wall biosynthesis